ncbi:hypothetical protein L7F22_031913 [Adiantum nelumboides]|nr:hypothetical protein [Adiantum nelumboides]
MEEMRILRHRLSILQEYLELHARRAEDLQGLLAIGSVNVMFDWTDGESETSQSTTFGSCPLAPEEEVGNVEVQFDLEEERVEVSKETFDAGLILASLADAAIGCKQENQNKEETLPLNCAPSFAMAGDFHYILLTDIMHELNIQEDYCLAAIAIFCESDIGFVDDEVDQHLIADTAVHDSQFTLGWQLLKDTFNEENSGAESQICQQMSNLNRQPNNWALKTWVLVYDDSFLRRAGGSQQGLVTGVQGKDAALSHYIRCFNHKKIKIYHKEYSKDNAKFSLFAMKVITRLCGGHPLPLNAERVILIEKQFALHIFGIGYGCQALKDPYFMSYRAPTLAVGVKDSQNLDPYNKWLFFEGEKMPDARRDAAINRGMSSSTELAHQRGTKQGGAWKRIKTTDSGPSSPVPDL